MKNRVYLKIVMLSALLMFISLNSNSYSEVELKTQTKALSIKAKVKAISTENSVFIEYNLVKFDNAFIIISDVFGNKIKIINIITNQGKIQISKSELEKAGGNGIYSCTIQVDGNQVISQPVAILNN